MGPMFRYERPQKGRYRQFHQIDVEALGFPGPDVDAELILMSARLWRVLGLRGLTLNLNSLGTPESRARLPREAGRVFPGACAPQLDADSLRRLDGNPLRILDSKNPAMAASHRRRAADHRSPRSGVGGAFRDAAARSSTAAGVDFVVNPRLVRGLDYYSRTVFEWVTTDLGSQDAVCSGGRYDGLVAQLGGDAVPAIGWALGEERIVELMRLQGLAAATRAARTSTSCSAGPAAEAAGLGARGAHPRRRCPACASRRTAAAAASSRS